MRRIHFYDGSASSSLIHLQRTNLNAGGVINNGTTFLIVASIARHLALYLKRSIKASLVHGQALLLKDFCSQLPGEAKGVVQLEGSSAIQLGLACFLQLSNLLVQELAALLQGAQEAGFFHVDNLLDIIALFSQIGIYMAKHADNDIHSTSQEFFANANQATVTYSAAQNAAQHIAATFVRGQNAIANHKGHAASVVGNNF